MHFCRQCGRIVFNGHVCGALVRLRPYLCTACGKVTQRYADLPERVWLFCWTCCSTEQMLSLQ